jgi:hypothetical protein
MLSKQQEVAIKCAIADLIGSMQAKNNLDFQSHDWKAHRNTIDELADAFPELCGDYKEQLIELN